MLVGCGLAQTGWVLWSCYLALAVLGFNPVAAGAVCEDQHLCLSPACSVCFPVCALCCCLQGIQLRGMQRDSTWNGAAEQYEQIFEWALMDQPYA